jgi:hypothetical protein
MAYANLTTLADVKGWLRTTSATDDALLSWLIKSLSEQAGRYCQRDNLGSVETYTERQPIPRATPSRSPFILLNRWPVITVTSILCAGQSIPVISDPMAVAASGAFVQDDRRTLEFYGAPASGGGVPLLQVIYTAGYTAVPPGLSQAVTQWVGEVARSQGWVGKVSEALAGQTVSYEQGRQWGMSKRTKEMFEPYRNRIPMVA